QTTQGPQAGDGRGVWHRTNRANEQIKDIVETSTTSESHIMTKRPRLENGTVAGTDIQMAGPAGQASQAA
ncbi:hypothetical protein A2U01_0002493, partial [Trifolium medium]|nr:hypothetical protein [Trifolium medium]